MTPANAVYFREVASAAATLLFATVWWETKNAVAFGFFVFSALMVFIGIGDLIFLGLMLTSR